MTCECVIYHGRSLWMDYTALNSYVIVMMVMKDWQFA